MITKLDGAEFPMKDPEFQVVHFSPFHYLENLHLWTPNLINSLLKIPDMFNVFYVIEDKLSHVPFAVSDSKTELQVYADLNGMKLSERDEEYLI